MSRFLVVLALLGLTACTMGPDYHLPDEAKINAPAARGAFHSATGNGLSTAPVPDGWWRLYDDARLNALEQEALAANDDLVLAAANLARAQAAQREVEGFQEVHADASFEALRSQLSGESFLVPSQLPSQYLGVGSVGVAYQLDLFGRLKRAAEAAEADKDAVAAGLDLARISVAAEVVRAYVDACAAGHELGVAQRQVDLQDRAHSVTARLAAAGHDSRLEVTRTAGQLDQVRALLPGLQARRLAALFRLAVLTGHPPADYPKDLESCAELPRIHRPIPVGDGAALLKRRPDIRQAERGLAAATARIGVATAALYPDVTLAASIGYDGLLADLAKPAAQDWALGPLISWTFPGGSEHARVEEANAAAAAALARFDGVVLNALRETETSLTLYAHDLERNAALHGARDRAAEAVGEADALYQAGRTPYLSDLAAQQSLAAVEQQLAASDSQVSLDQVTLFLALGGGWP